MREWLAVLTENAVLIIDTIALIVILIGTIDALIHGIRMILKPGHDELRAVWLRYARWLIGGLTFQLAADIIETSIRTDWESIAKLGAIAAVRTFLNYFLERDVQEVRNDSR